MHPYSPLAYCLLQRLLTGVSDITPWRYDRTRYNLRFRRSASGTIGWMSREGRVLTADFWNVALTLLGILVAVSGLYWRVRNERIRAEEKLEERRNAQIASIAGSLNKDMDRLRDQVQASDQRMRELESGTQRAIGRIEGVLEAKRQPG